LCIASAICLRLFALASGGGDAELEHGGSIMPMSRTIRAIDDEEREQP